MYEENRLFGFPSEEYLLGISWSALSSLLSKGVGVSVDGEIMRPIGINYVGELEAIGVEGVVSIGDLDGVQWMID